MLKLTHVAVPRKLPVILSPEEFGRPIAAALRVSKVVSLKVGDIDGERMTLRFEEGKCPESLSVNSTMPARVAQSAASGIGNGGQAH